MHLSITKEHSYTILSARSVFGCTQRRIEASHCPAGAENPVMNSPMVSLPSAVRRKSKNPEQASRKILPGSHIELLTVYGWRKQTSEV